MSHRGTDNMREYWEKQLKKQRSEKPVEQAQQLDPAHARLIAAAPDLLEALDRIDRTLANAMHVQDNMREPLAQARAALAKARGE